MEVEYPNEKYACLDPDCPFNDTPRIMGEKDASKHIQFCKNWVFEYSDISKLTTLFDKSESTNHFEGQEMRFDFLENPF